MMDRQQGRDTAEKLRTEKLYDVIGIGFGPANLALAVAMEESTEEEGLDGLFLEAKPSYVWHPGMLLEGSQLQINVLKDLITIEKPTSRFTFLNYLKEKGRLYDFLNLRTLFPTRIEFNDYLAWAAEQLRHRVEYDRRVMEIQPVSRDGEIDRENPELLRIVARHGESGETSTYLTRHLVLATGGEPVGPQGVDVWEGGLEGSRRAFHSHQFLDKIRAFPDRQQPYRFVVVGSGQSAGELFEYLMDNYPNADVTATIRRFAYKPVDESDFTNRIFFPEWTDYYYELPNDKRREFFADMRDVNYAVIDQPLIRRINQKLYDQKVAGRERCRIQPFVELERIEEHDDHLELQFRDLMGGEPVRLEADGAVLCTGYVWRKEHPLLDGLASFIERDDRGGYAVRRDYALATRGELRPNVYLQGYCEDTHGISETVLSLLPVRAREILTSIRTGLRANVEVVAV